MVCHLYGFIMSQLSGQDLIPQVLFILDATKSQLPHQCSKIEEQYINNMEHPKERDWKSSFSRALGNDKKLKDTRNVAIAFNNLFITIIEKFNIQQIEKGDAIAVLKQSFPRYFPCIHIIPISEAGVKSIIHSL